MFKKKQFQGKQYSFEHLQKSTIAVPLNAAKTKLIYLDVEYSHHCFTETFDYQIHRDEHKYTHNKELRAFDITRFECSLHLPQVLDQMLNGMIYQSDKSYTYTAQIQIQIGTGHQKYSVFFSLEKHKRKENFLFLYIKSAYMKPSVAKPNTQNWRFRALAGEIAGVFPAPRKKGRP